MKKIKNISAIIGMLTIAAIMFSCEKDVDERKIVYSVKDLTQEYKVSYVENGEAFTQVVQGVDFEKSFMAEKGEVLYFDIQHSEDVNKMSGFAAMITINGKIFKESYSYDIKWDTTANPYPYEIKLTGTVPY